MCLLAVRGDKGVMSDVELVELFWENSKPNGRRSRSLFGYRSWMLKHSPQLYRILLDGLQAKQEPEMERCGHLKSEQCDCLELNGLISAGGTR